MNSTNELQKTADQRALQKEQNLRTLMRGMDSVLVAYSGGVDSSYLALIATQELGKNAICISGISPSVSEEQISQASQTADQFGFQFESIDTNEMADPNYTSNPANRCYFCKSELYKKLSEIAFLRGIGNLVDGANQDDFSDYRPGKQAADENSIGSPLAEVGFTKDEIRIRSREHGLQTWDKPASPCLSSRIQYGVPVSIERLSKIEKGEIVLRDLGFREFRVRYHDHDLVRIEISKSEFAKAIEPEVHQMITASFRKLGIKYITLDLDGFRSGSMNEILPKKTSTEDSSNSYINRVDK